MTTQRPQGRLSKPVWLALMLSLALTAWAWWSPDPATPTVEANLPPPVDVNAAAEKPNSPAVTTSALPPSLARPIFGIAKSDPFVDLPPPKTPQLRVVAQAPTTAPAPQAMPAPPAPTMNYRFLGRFTDPDGQNQTYLIKSDAPILIRQGARLDDGYIVSALETQLIRLNHEPSGTTVTISIPPNSENN